MVSACLSLVATIHFALRTAATIIMMAHPSSLTFSAFVSFLYQFVYTEKILFYLHCLTIHLSISSQVTLYLAGKGYILGKRTTRLHIYVVSLNLKCQPNLVSDNGRETNQRISANRSLSVSRTANIMTNAHIYEENCGPMNVSYSRTEGECRP